MNKEISGFIDRYVKAIKDNSAAMFLGAGFSKSAGYVDWKSLLKNVADDLNLDIDKEYDLVSLAQYCYNKNKNRSIINDVIIDEFTKEKKIDENHQIVARLPIFTYWTTNYDSLIEDSLVAAKRVVDVKVSNKQLSITKHHRDAIVYKMHGDKDNPDEAILIKDDYEKYYKDHAQFITALSGDLISKTFLFIGFSFTDPNIDYILSRVRIDYEENNRQHYAIMRKVKRNDYSDQAEYEYTKRKQEFFIEDLKRYQISALCIDEYSEITEILTEIERRLNHNNIFISGSASEFEPYDEEEASNFIRLLSQKLIEKDFNIISGFGLGVGSSVIVGALEEIYMSQKKINEDRLLLRPFPQGISDDVTRQTLWQQYREDMISRAGVSIFLFGNKKLENGDIVLANGMQAELKIAKEKHNLIVPVGCTGYVAQEIWNEVNEDLSLFYTNVDSVLIDAFKKLNCKDDKEQLVDNIISFINLFRNGEYSPR